MGVRGKKEKYERDGSLVGGRRYKRNGSEGGGLRRLFSPILLLCRFEKRGLI